MEVLPGVIMVNTDKTKTYAFWVIYDNDTDKDISEIILDFVKKAD
jgi:hypothetical protein